MKERAMVVELVVGKAGASEYHAGADGERHH